MKVIVNKSTPMDLSLKLEVKSLLFRTKELLDSKILWEDERTLYQQSIFIEILINLKDLLKKSDKLGNRINFKDDITPDPELKIIDITDLIINFRNAACHSDSFRRSAGKSILAFNTFKGKSRMNLGNFFIGCAYDDDIAFNMGKNILYLKRHIERTFLELDNFFKPLVIR